MVRVVCRSRDTAGSGFLHKSGRIITAHHVVAACSDIEIWSGRNGPIKVSSVIEDRWHDLALLTTALPIKGPTLELSKKSGFSLGLQVSAWGFPAGYSGGAPLLSVGYLAGIETLQTPIGTEVHRLVINAAFNSGNSGGPLLSVETGEVIGVVSSKLAPVPPNVMAVLDGLKRQTGGMVYTATTPDGKEVKITQGQMLSLVLEHLRRQVQLVIGHAATVSDIRALFEKHQIKP